MSTLWQRLAIAGACALTFARALPYPLQRSWDDGRFLIDNPDVRRVSWETLRALATRVRFEAYHPLHLLSYWLDVPWFGPSGLPLHVTSLVLWIAAMLLLHAVLRELGLGARAALAGTLACALHPVQVEAVSWATGRKDVLAMGFACAFLLLHLRARTAWDRAAWLSRAACVLAVLSKTTAVPLPLVALTLDVALRRRGAREALKAQLPALALVAVVGLAVLATWQEHEMVRATAGGAALAPVRLGATLVHQLGVALWPARTSPMYATTELLAHPWQSLGAVAAALLAAVLSWRRAPRLLAASLTCFLWLLLPVSNLVPMYFPWQDRYLSLPLLALAIGLAALIDHAATSLRLRGATELAFALVTVLALRTIQYQGVWSSEARLWGHAASTQPRAEYAWLKLGEVRRDAGDIDGAISAYRGLLRVAPTRKLAHAALFEAVALRDERRRDARTSRARELAGRYYLALDDAGRLLELVSLLHGAGYRDAASLAASRLRERAKARHLR